MDGADHVHARISDGADILGPRWNQNCEGCFGTGMQIDVDLDSFFSSATENPIEANCASTLQISNRRELSNHPDLKSSAVTTEVPFRNLDCSFSRVASVSSSFTVSPYLREYISLSTLRELLE